MNTSQRTSPGAYNLFIKIGMSFTKGRSHYDLRKFYYIVQI